MNSDFYGFFFFLLDSISVDFVLNLTSFEKQNLHTNNYHKLTDFLEIIYKI